MAGYIIIIFIYLFEWVYSFLSLCVFLYSCVFFSGDLRLVEKPSPITLGPQDFASIRASIKVSSTENGIIFGNISKKDRTTVTKHTETFQF